MDKYCERCSLRDAKPCMECNTCNPGHRNFRPAPHTPTHADRIRAMSDEELADWLLWMQTNDISVRWCCKPECYARIERLGDEFDCTDIMVKACAVDWLKKPAEEE